MKSPVPFEQCQHPRVRVHNLGISFPCGVEQCRVCGGERYFEGDHDDQWGPAGSAPARRTPPSLHRARHFVVRRRLPRETAGPMEVRERLDGVDELTL